MSALTSEKFFFFLLWLQELLCGESRLFCEPHSSELDWFDLFSSSSELAFFMRRLALANQVDTCRGKISFAVIHMNTWEKNLRP